MRDHDLRRGVHWAESQQVEALASLVTLQDEELLTQGSVLQPGIDPSLPLSRWHPDHAQVVECSYNGQPQATTRV